MSIATPFVRDLQYAQVINRAHPLNRGLVDAWMIRPNHMGETKLLDLNNRGLHGSYVGGAIVRPVRRPGGWGAIQFDTTAGQRCDMGTSTLLAVGQMTLALWVQHRGTPVQFQSLAGRVSDSAWNDGYGMFWNSATEVRFFRNDFALNVAAATVASPQQWHHVVGTWDGATVRIYVDGVEGTSDAFAGAATHGGPFSVGAIDPFTTGANAWIDDVRVYDRALSQHEVVRLYYLSRRGHPGVLNRVSRMWIALAPAAGWGRLLSGRRNRLVGVG